MKIKRQTTLGEALDEVVAVAQRIRSGEAAEVDGHTLGADDQVLLEIELERENGKAELEFEIKWPPEGAETEREEDEGRRREQRRSRGSRRARGRAILGVVGLLLLGAALVPALLRRRQPRGGEG